MPFASKTIKVPPLKASYISVVFLSDMLDVIHLTLVHSEWCHYKNNDLKFMAKYPHIKHLTFPFPPVLECTSQN